MGFLLYISGIFNLHFLSYAKDFEIFLSVAIIIFSYFMGFIAHRSIRIFIVPPYRFVKSLFLKIFKKNTSKNKIDRAVSDEDVVLIFQHGTTAIQQQINYQYQHLLICRLLMFGFTTIPG